MNILYRLIIGFLLPTSAFASSLSPEHGSPGQASVNNTSLYQVEWNISPTSVKALSSLSVKGVTFVYAGSKARIVKVVNTQSYISNSSAVLERNHTNTEITLATVDSGLDLSFKVSPSKDRLLQVDYSINNYDLSGKDNGFNNYFATDGVMLQVPLLSSISKNEAISVLPGSWNSIKNGSKYTVKFRITLFTPHR